MSEPHTDIYLFRHFHQKTTKELTELIKEEMPTLTDETQKALFKKHKTTLDNILKNLAEDEPDPESIFKKALSALSEIDQERFLLENLLEAVKQQKRSLNGVLQTYHALGLTDIDANQINEGERVTGTDVPGSSVGSGKLLGRMLGTLKKIAIKTIQLCINAMKAIPRFVGIRPSIGFSGPFPTFSIEFELEMESVTLHDLFEHFAR